MKTEMPRRRRTMDRVRERAWRCGELAVAIKVGGDCLVCAEVLQLDFKVKSFLPQRSRRKAAKDAEKIAEGSMLGVARRWTAFECRRGSMVTLTFNPREGERTISCGWDR